MPKIIAIHQPNFFPWLGYFDKMARSDVFVFLDHVQFPKTGGVWSNRVKMLIAKEPRWVTAPIKRDFHGVASINKIEWDDGQPWRVKYLKTIAANYSRSPFYRETMEMLVPLVESPITNLSRFNIEAIKVLAKHVGVRHQHTVASSELQLQGTASDLLIEITQKVNGSAYMCGGGAAGYQQDEAFERAGIRLVYQGFEHPKYLQNGSTEFVAGLSIIDALMNIGQVGVCELLRKI